MQFATVQALMRCAILYSFAKERSGPLKSGVETVEEAVKTVVAPLYDKFHLVPAEFLRYVDRKVIGVSYHSSVILLLYSVISVTRPLG